MEYILHFELEFLAGQRAGVGLEDVSRQIDDVLHLESNPLALLWDFAAGLDFVALVPAAFAFALARLAVDNGSVAYG